jgi:hypothetical protein
MARSLSLSGQQLSLTCSSDLFCVDLVLTISARGAQRQQTVIENQTVAFLGRFTQKRASEWDLRDGSKSEAPAHSAISTKSAAWDFPSRFRCRSNHEDSKPKASPNPPVKRPVHDFSVLRKPEMRKRAAAAQMAESATLKAGQWPYHGRMTSRKSIT